LEARGKGRVAVLLERQGGGWVPRSAVPAPRRGLHGLTISPSGRYGGYLLEGPTGTQVRVIDFSSRRTEPRGVFPLDPRAGQRLACDDEGNVYVWHDGGDPHLMQFARSERRHLPQIRQVVTSREGAYGVTWSGDSVLHLTHLRSGHRRRYALGAADAPPDFRDALLSDDGGTIAALFTGSKSVLRGWSSAVVVWAREQPEPQAVVPLGLPLPSIDLLYCEWQK
jgi:hypothetical protein